MKKSRWIFGSVIDKDLYLNTRTVGQAFEIHLEECDLTVGKTVNVTFTGTENGTLPGLLAIQGGSQATGIAIGFETPSAKPLQLNQAGSKLLLQEGHNIIALKAYVQGEPDALRERRIERGAFSAAARSALSMSRHGMTTIERFKYVGPEWQRPRVSPGRLLWANGLSG
ncbi:Fimbrial adapter papK precursor [Serratia fonticola]|uniref:Fimbrial adapter papK n=1 Tax=Serratia fonticola TaxID=47917 RepID=A0A4U9UT42_SERFO|nr:Fimbrial adapter papK precursor [Serratia fonticola]